jgi:microcin-processing metallopeptidase PmbA/TldD-like protein
MDRYTGPVLFEGEAAGQLVASVLTPVMIGVRRPGQGGSSDKLRTRVLPAWVSVSDDPTLTVYDGHSLLGHYKVDDEGVTGRETRLVVGGFLQTLLSTRTPVEGVDGSTGNARGFGASPSSLIVRTDSGVSDAVLKKRFLALLQLRKLPYGVVIRKMQGGQSLMQLMMEGDIEALMARESGRGSGYNSALIAAYRVYPDGHEERIRQGRLTNFSTENFRDLLAASAATSVYHSSASGGMMEMFAMGGMGGGAAPSSFVVPSLLFDDVTVTKQNLERTTLPLSDPPPGS